MSELLFGRGGSANAIVNVAAVEFRFWAVVLSFGGNYYKQTSGVAMGTKMGPSYANLFVGFIDHQFFSQYHGQNYTLPSTQHQRFFRNLPLYSFDFWFRSKRPSIELTCYQRKTLEGFIPVFNLVLSGHTYFNSANKTTVISLRPHENVSHNRTSRSAM